MRAHRTALAALASLAIAGAAGCSSSDTKNDYVDTVNAIQTDALKAVNDATATPPNDVPQVTKQLESAERILGEAVAELEQVDVPSEAEDGHPKLVGGIEEMQALFAETAAEIEKASDAEAFAKLTGLVAESATISAEIDRAISQINQELGAS